MAGLTFVTYSLPARWASAMINLDYSGLDTAEKTEVIKWKMETPHGICADVSDETYFGQFNGLGDQLADYKFIKI